jgi:hypothetical protein
MSADHIDALVEKLAEKSAVQSIPDNCFAMIRVPVSLTALAGFANIAAKMHPGCVMRQVGHFMLMLHPEKKEDA